MKKVHFIGICGKGMSAVAKLLIDTGIKVTGSDEGFYPPVSTYIERNNIPFIKGYRKENIANDVDTVVIGKHAALNENDNEEVKFAFELKRKGLVEIKSFPEILEEITKEKENIVVAGSFGKSTCTSLLSYLLIANNLDIGYFIGATPTTPKTNAEIGAHKNFILEGDEYPSANWDMTSKFMYYNAHDILLTSLAHDHINIFKTHAEFKQVFYNLISQLCENSNFKNDDVDCNLVLCYDDEHLQKEFSGIKSTLLFGHVNLTTYSLFDESCNYFAKNINFGEVTSFDLNDFGTLETKLLGKHNIQNIVGVCALILEKKLLTFEQIQKVLINFEAVEGRLNEIKTKSGFKMFEGFGSSVDKAKSAIEAIKLHFPNKQIKIIFEPYTFSWRNMDAISWYDEVFKGCEKVYVYEPPTHGINTHTQLTQEQIVERIRLSNVNVDAISNVDESVTKIISEINIEHDIILTISPSNIGGIPKLISERI